MRVKVVDGYRIRNTVDVEFSMIADRDTFPYVPKDEVWLERYYLPEKAEVLAREVKLVKLLNWQRRKQ